MTDDPSPASSPDTESPDPSERRPGMHDHVHRHEGEATHAHPHHHTGALAARPERAEGIPLVHDHGHGLSFERFTFLVSPVHSLDPRAKIVAALLIVLTVVVSPPPRALEFAGIAGLLLAAVVVAGVPVSFVLRRSALVLPFAGAIALFAPLAREGGALSVVGVTQAYSAGGWVAAYAILARAWLATLSMVVLSTTTPVPRLFKGLERLRVPDVILLLLGFMYRYVAVMREQISSLRRALDSRGFALSRWDRVRLYGNLAGATFVRAYERGERVHAAMTSRGFDGTLPSAETLAFRPADALMLVTVILAVAALALY